MDELSQWRAARRRRGAFIAALTVFVLSLLALAAFWFARAAPVPPPQAGQVLPGGAVVAWSPGYRVSFYGIERLHPADASRYDKVAAHLVGEGLVPADGFAIPAPASDADLGRVHDASYLAELNDAASLSRALELTVPSILGPAAVERRVLTPFRLAAGGSVVAARAALEHGVGVNLGGGFHHARPAMGHGFCVYGDVALAIATLRDEGFSGPVLVVDTDAHQGDGNHAFFRDDPSVFSFSMHQGDIFPSPKLGGDGDVALRAGTDDEAFLAELQGSLDRLIDEVQPELVVHVAGSDVLRDDPLAGLALSVEGLVERDLAVFRAARRSGASYLHTLAGGYGPSSAKAQGRSVAAILRELRGRG